MDSLIYVIFICIALPLLLSLGLVEKKSRLVISFIIIGGFMCVFVSGVNGLMKDISNEDYYYLTTNITPITEEIVKALPVLIFVFLFSDDRDQLLTISMAIGIGFAIVENIQIFVSNDAGYTLFWSIRRVFGASLMHGLCTTLVGYGISFVKKRKKLFYTGTFSLLVLAIVYHSIFNSLVQSNYSWIGFLMPVLTYVPMVIVVFKQKAQSKKQKAQSTKHKVQSTKHNEQSNVGMRDER